MRFPFPGSRLRQLVPPCSVPTKPATIQRAERLVWTVLKVLPDLLDHDSATSLRQWWERHHSAPGQLNKDQWQLARGLADAMDDYALYRPQELAEWLAGESGTTLPDGLQWQPVLARAIAKQLPCQPFGLQVQQAVLKLRDGQQPAQPLPPRLRLFGVSNLAPVQVNLLQALAGPHQRGTLPADPLPGSLAALATAPTSARRQLDGLTEWFLADRSPTPGGILGRMGAEFQLLLEGSGDCMLGSWEQGDLFADPTAMNNGDSAAPTLLEQLQRQLAAGEAEPSQLFLPERDQSLQFMGCAGPWQEVQLVRDRILGWMADDPTLQPRDVLVMTPDVERYAPLLPRCSPIRMPPGWISPWRLDRPQPAELPRAAAGLHEPAASQCRSAHRQWTRSPAGQSSAAGPARHQLQRCDGHHRSAAAQWLSLGPRCQRAQRRRQPQPAMVPRPRLLGLTLPEQPGLALGDCAPALTDVSLQELELWWPLLDRLAGWISRLRISAPCPVWVERLQDLLQDLFLDSGDWDWEWQAIQAKPGHLATAGS